MESQWIVQAAGGNTGGGSAAALAATPVAQLEQLPDAQELLVCVKEALHATATRNELVADAGNLPSTYLLNWHRLNNVCCAVMMRWCRGADDYAHSMLCVAMLRAFVRQLLAIATASAVAAEPLQL